MEGQEKYTNKDKLFFCISYMRETIYQYLKEEITQDDLVALIEREYEISRTL